MKKKLLIIGHVWPEPKSSAAGGRMMQLITAFQKEHYDVVFASACAKSDNAFDLSSIGVVQATIILNDASFDGFVKNMTPDVVLFDRFMTEEQFGWRVIENCRAALRILDTEDLHSLRKGRQQAFKDGNDFDKSYLFNELSKREMASIYRCDLSLIISEVEMGLLKNAFRIPENLLLYLPFQLDPISEEFVSELPAFESRAHFVTIGNFLHEPNYNSILYLKETIWPFIREKLPNAEMNIYGAYVSQKINQLHNTQSGFIIKGFAPDVNEIMKTSRVCLAPLRFGAGLKGKLIDAMQNGTPCVMTSIASEGMFGDLEPNGYVENSPELFAEKAIILYQNEAVWKEKQKHGFKTINARFNKKDSHKRLFSSIELLNKQLEEHRHGNFTGQMLQHHALQSTKYMSKWIEAKNK